MSFEFIYNTMPKYEFDPVKKLTICGNRFSPKKKSNQIFLAESDAEEMLANEVENEQCGYAFFYDVGDTEVKSTRIKKAQAKLDTAVKRYVEKGQVFVAKAARISTWMCLSCGKRVAIENAVATAERYFNGLLPQLNKMAVKGVNVKCPGCSQTGLPFTSTQKAALDALMVKVKNAQDEYTQAYSSELESLAKKNKIGISVMVAAWVHESYLEGDDDE